MKVIGITGGVGAGKSTVVDILRKHFETEYLHCDVIAHEVMEPGGSAHEELLRLFGKDIVNEDGMLNRTKLYEVAFLGGRVEELNACVHPKVRDFVEERIAFLRKSGFSGMVLIEAALLIEAGYKEICDELWYIYADEQIRRKRLKESRNYSDEKIDSIMESQLDEEEFRKHCKVVIDNSGSLAKSYEQIDRKLGDYL